VPRTHARDRPTSDRRDSRPLLHRGTAAGGIDRDAIDAGALERRDRRPRETPGIVETAGMRASAAAAQIARRDDVAALGTETSDRRRVDVGKVRR
jgi:hypothetical protein